MLPGFDETAKRRLRTALRRLHGPDYIKPFFDERHFAAITVSQHHNSGLIEEICKYPAVNWLEVMIQNGSNPGEVTSSIARLVTSLSGHLERLRIEYELDVSEEHTLDLRNIMPPATVFASLPKIQVVEFQTVNAGDQHLRALCSNQTLYRLSLYQCDVTRRCAKYAALCQGLGIFEIIHCAGVTPKSEAWFRSKLPDVRVVRVKGDGTN